MAKATPRSNLSNDLNKLIFKPRNSSTLAPRESRSPIEAQRGSGKGSDATGGGGTEATNVTDKLTSSDGAFVIYYDYHTHE